MGKPKSKHTPNDKEVTIKATARPDGGVDFTARGGRIRVLRKHTETIAHALIWRLEDGSFEAECIDMGAASDGEDLNQVWADLAVRCMDLYDTAAELGHPYGFAPSEEDFKLWNGGPVTIEGRTLIHSIKLVRSTETFTIRPDREEETVEYFVQDRTASGMTRLSEALSV